MYSFNNLKIKNLNYKELYKEYNIEFLIFFKLLKKLCIFFCCLYVFNLLLYVSPKEYTNTKEDKLSYKEAKEIIKHFDVDEDYYRVTKTVTLLSTSNFIVKREVLYKNINYISR